MLLNVIKHDNEPWFLGTSPMQFTLIDPLSNHTHLCPFLISAFAFVQKDYLSSANTTLKIIIQLSPGINWDPSSGGIQSTKNNVKLTPSSWPFSMEDGFKLRVSINAEEQEKTRHTLRAVHVDCNSYHVALSKKL